MKKNNFFGIKMREEDACCDCCNRCFEKLEEEQKINWDSICEEECNCDCIECVFEWTSG